MACALTQGVSRSQCRKGIGGVKDVYIIETANILSVVYSSGVITAINKAPGTQFQKYELPRETATASDKPTGSRQNGTKFSAQTVTIVLNGRTAALRNEIETLMQVPVTIITVENRNDGWAYGIEEGLMLEDGEIGPGTTWGDRNGATLNLTGSERETANPVTADVVSSLTTAGSGGSGGTPGTLQAPTLSAQRSGNSALLTFDNPTGGSAIVVEQSSDNGATWSVISTVSYSQTSYEKTGLTAATPYKYRAKTIDQSGTLAPSGYSSVVSITTHDTVIRFTGGNPANAGSVNANTGGVGNNVKFISFNARTSPVGTPNSMVINQIPGSGLTPSQQFSVTFPGDYIVGGVGDNFAFAQADGKIAYDKQFVNGTIN